MQLGLNKGIYRKEKGKILKINKGVGDNIFKKVIRFAAQLFGRPEY